MIDLSSISDETPLYLFKKFYEEAFNNKQKNIEAVVISSYDSAINYVDSRYVNLKYVIENQFIFFSNYMSPKSIQFGKHDQVSMVFFWNAINLQIRIAGNIKKCSDEFSDNHFLKRSDNKNALSISSMQSQTIQKYQDVINNYEEVKNNKKILKIRPKYWGGFAVTPYSFEFWEGHESRINKRNLYTLKDTKWIHKILQP